MVSQLPFHLVHPSLPSFPNLDLQMFAGREPPAGIISEPVLVKLFPPSPPVPPTPISPRNEPVASGIKIHVPTSVLVAPPSLTPASAHPASNSFGGSASSSQQGDIGSESAPGAVATRGQDGLTVGQVKSAARGRLREIHCAWKDDGSSGPCDAVLASHSIYQKHLKRHYEREIEAAERRNEPGQIFYNTRCGWQGCTRVFPFGVSDLLRHVESAHLREVKETWCPFRLCPRQNITREEYHDPSHFSGYGHSRPWSVESSLYAHPDPREDDLRVDLPPMPPLPQTGTIHPFLCEAQPYRGTRVKPYRRTKFYKPGDQPVQLPSLVEVRDLIVPINRNHYYIAAQAFDCPSGFHPPQALSSSFLPFPAIHTINGNLDYMDVSVRVPGRGGMKIIDVWDGMRQLDASSDPNDETSPFDVDFAPPGSRPRKDTDTSFLPRKRPNRPHERLPLDAITCIQRSKIQLEEDKPRRREERLKRKREGLIGLDMDDEARKAIPDDQLPVDTDRVLRASKRRAKKHAHVSYGYEHWEERMRFERWGIELGEIECRVSS